MSVPEPIANPTSALTSAGLSLIPSPTKATFFPLCCNFDISFSLSCGNTSEITLLISNCLPIAFATILLSPCKHYYIYVFFF